MNMHVQNYDIKLFQIHPIPIPFAILILMLFLILVLITLPILILIPLYFVSILLLLIQITIIVVHFLNLIPIGLFNIRYKNSLLNFVHFLQFF
jgi:hypothetical protein